MTFLLLNIHNKLLQNNLNQQWSVLVELVWYICTHARTHTRAHTCPCIQTHTHTHTYLYKTASLLPTNLKFLNTRMDLGPEINTRRIRIYSPTCSLNLRKSFQERKALFGGKGFPPLRPLKSRDMFYNLQPAHWQISILSNLTDCLSVKLPLSCIPTTANSCTETFTFTATTCTLCNLCHWSLIRSSAHMFSKCLHK